MRICWNLFWMFCHRKIDKKYDLTNFPISEANFTFRILSNFQSQTNEINYFRAATVNNDVQEVVIVVRPSKDSKAD